VAAGTVAAVARARRRRPLVGRFSSRRPPPTRGNKMPPANCRRCRRRFRHCRRACEGHLPSDARTLPLPAADRARQRVQRAPKHVDGVLFREGTRVGNRSAVPPPDSQPHRPRPLHHVPTNRRRASKSRRDPRDTIARGAAVDGAISGAACHRRCLQFRRLHHRPAAGRQRTRGHAVRRRRVVHPPEKAGGGARWALGGVVCRDRPRSDDRGRAADEPAADDRGHVNGRRQARAAIGDDGGLAQPPDTTTATTAAIAAAATQVCGRHGGGPAAV